MRPGKASLLQFNEQVSNFAFAYPQEEGTLGAPLPFVAAVEPLPFAAILHC